MEEADRGVPQEDPSVYERCRAEALSTLNYRLVLGGPFLHQLCLDVIFFVLGRCSFHLISTWTLLPLSHISLDVFLYHTSTSTYLFSPPLHFWLSWTYSLSLYSFSHSYVLVVVFSICLFCLASLSLLSLFLLSSSS